MELIAKQAWASEGTSGGLAELYLPMTPAYCVLYVDYSTLKDTQSIEFQSAQNSTGPWLAELSTVMATAVSTRHGMRVTGPVGPWVRPYLKSASTGTYHFEFLGVG